MLRCACIPSSGSWAISTTGGTATQGYDYNLPPNASAGVVTVSTNSPTCGGTPGGTSFVVKADGVTILTTGCIVNNSQQVNVPLHTLVVHVDVVNNCSGTNQATYSISGAG